MFKKLRMWVWSKKSVISQLMNAEKQLHVFKTGLMNLIVELDQSKVYVCVMPGASEDEVETGREAFRHVATDLKWTMPKIIFMNADIKEKKRSVKK